ncbi:hypothetical protein BJV74DRAFT_260940 [Russula compacta]|nr:hypothetical protein BJV74DRAFT_260940 [Russula compacta]
MPGTEHSADLKERVHHLSRLAFTAEEISHLLALLPATVYRALQQDPGSFDTRRNFGGRPRNLTSHDVETQPDLYLDELKEEMELQGIEISLSSLCRYLHRNGITHKRCLGIMMNHPIIISIFRDTSAMQWILVRTV